MAGFFAMYPNIGNRAHLEKVYLSPAVAGQGMRELRSSGEQLCTMELSEQGLGHQQQQPA